MKQHLLKEIEVGTKNALLKKKIITHYIYNGSSTITDLAKELDLSVPTVTKFISEMCEEGYINDYGKLETSGGRYPSLYGLNPESGYFIGVDIKKFRELEKDRCLPDSEIIWKLYNLFHISPAVVLKDKNSMINEISSLIEAAEENGAEIIDIIKQI